MAEDAAEGEGKPTLKTREPAEDELGRLFNYFTVKYRLLESFGRA